MRELHSTQAGIQVDLQALSVQAAKLSAGLQNAAPKQVPGPSNSVLYLHETAQQLDAICKKINKSIAALMAGEV